MKRFAAGALVLLLLVVATFTMGADQYRIQKGDRFHGEFSTTDATAATLTTESSRRITLYGEGSKTAVAALGANDYVIITDISCTGVTNGQSFLIYDGADVTQDAGEVISNRKALGATGAPQPESFVTPFVCQPGTYPKVVCGVAAQVDVTIKGVIYRAGS